MAAAIIGFKSPEDSVTPSWLLDEGRATSKALYQQGLRVRGPPGKGTPNAQGATGNKGDGRGKGRGQAQQPNQAPA